jgi:tRNA(Arg) A34 adenosine deaminase TadA
MNTTEKYIKKAVDEAKKEFGGNVITDCSVTMNNQADGATQILAEALRAQSEANEANSLAMLELAKTLKPIDVCAVKIVGNDVNYGGKK